LKYSVNTWDQGFLDKLYASTNAVSVHRLGHDQKHEVLISFIGRTRQRTPTRNLEHKCENPQPF
jgi:hypothetical protein